MLARLGGRLIALYALWRAWRGRKDWPPEPSLLELQMSLNVLRTQRREAAERVGYRPEIFGASQIQPVRFRAGYLA